jgi:hypothetical protein
MFNIVVKDIDIQEKIFKGIIAQLPQVKGLTGINEGDYQVIEIKSIERFNEYDNLYIISVRKLQTEVI